MKLVKTILVILMLTPSFALAEKLECSCEVDTNLVFQDGLYIASGSRCDGSPTIYFNLKRKSSTLIGNAGSSELQHFYTSRDAKMKRYIEPLGSGNLNTISVFEVDGNRYAFIQKAYTLGINPLGDFSSYNVLYKCENIDRIPKI